MSLICEIILYSTDFKYVVVDFFDRYTRDGRNISHEFTQLKGKIAATAKQLAAAKALTGGKKKDQGNQRQKRLERVTTLTTDLQDLRSQLAALKDVPLINNLARKTAHNNKQYAIRIIKAHKAEG